MSQDPNLFWFGCVLWLVSVLVIFNLVYSHLPKKVAATQKQVHPIKYAYVINTDEEKEIAQLRQECARLRQKLQQQSQKLREDFQYNTFYQLETLLTNYPTVCKVVREHPDLPAKNILPLFKSLDKILAHWGYEAIGSPLAQVPYNPQLHQTDDRDITVGEKVYIWFVGYQDSKLEHIISPAIVSRNLPPIPNSTKSYAVNFT
ncbi:molecular chaperone GrpE [Floridanema evergladense]|uniref:Molecular chaperone GrpE n=1 Tax=Floridaenema evergladense BLCC-F167 TaxID=3153639 RepID=A0ABV4WMT2_9CYAN